MVMIFYILSDKYKGFMILSVAGNIFSYIFESKIQKCSK